MSYDYKTTNFLSTPSSGDNRIRIYDKNNILKYTLEPDISYYYTSNTCLVIKITNKNDIRLQFENKEESNKAITMFKDILSRFNPTMLQTSSDINIPNLNLYSMYYDNTVRRSENLMGYWSADNKNFLNYNPEIWLFRYKNNTKKVELNGSRTKINHKKYIHTPHLNGSKYPNSSYYGGGINSFVSEIQNTGVHTEFLLDDISGTTSNHRFKIPIDPYDWFYMFDYFNSYKLNDSLPLENSGFYIKVLGRKKNISFPFKLSIVIDDPSGGQQKIIGPLSDKIFLRLEHQKFIYRMNEREMSSKRYNM
jgi:hypothetical protein